MDDSEKVLKEIVPIRYGSYVNLRNASTEATIMLAELIDNSISSKEENEGLDIDKWKKPLKILIQLKVVGGKEKRKREKKISEGLKVVKETSLTVIDNAYGIKRRMIKDALTLDKKNYSKSKMNVHGRGLKQSAFWWGIDLHVTTKTKENEYYQTNLCLSEQKEGLESIVRIQPQNLSANVIKEMDKIFNKLEDNNHEIVKKNESGTIIEIKNLYTDTDRCLTELQYKKIIQNLAFRYKRYIEKKEKFSIILTYIDIANTNDEKNMVRNNLYDLKHKYETNLKLYQINIPKIRELLLAYNVNVTPKREKNALENIKKLLEDKFTNVEDRIRDLFYDGVKFNYIMDLCNQFKEWLFSCIDNCIKKGDKYDERFYKDFYLKLPDSLKERKLKIKIWALHERTKEEANKAGFWIYEGNRAIHHPINWVWQDAKKEQKSNPKKGSTINRFGGEFSIDELGIHTSHDKTKILWGDNDLKKYLVNALYFLWKTFDILILGTRDEKKKEPLNLSKEVKESIEEKLAKYDRNMEKCFNGSIEVKTTYEANKSKSCDFSPKNYLKGFLTKILYIEKQKEFEVEYVLNHDEISSTESILKINKKKNQEDYKISFIVNIEHIYFKNFNYEETIEDSIDFYINSILQPFNLVIWNMYRWMNYSTKNAFFNSDSDDFPNLFSTEKVYIPNVE